MNKLDDILNLALKTHTLTEIARMAGMSYSHLRDVRRGRRPATPALERGVARAARRLTYARSNVRMEIATIYQVVQALCAIALGIDPAAVQDSDPSAKRAANKDWRDAAFARWLAQSLLNSGLGISQIEVARASGVTKQAVSLAMHAIEDKRDDPAFDALVTQLEFIVKPRRRNAQ